MKRFYQRTSGSDEWATPEPIFADGQVTLYHGHVMDVLRGLPDESVQCVVTSPPYWALRAYGTEPQVWGGDPECEHEWTDTLHKRTTGVDNPGPKQSTNGGALTIQRGVAGGHCACGAWRGELGHEPTPQMFVAHLVEIFREVRRVLKSDGVCFVNLGDSYSGSGKGPSNALQRPASSLNNGQLEAGAAPTEWIPVPPGTKPKDLVLIPERFALAMQDDGWWVRSRIAWAKKSCMPESVTDRPTSAWEHVWMLSKSQRYFWDAQAVREPSESGPSDIRKMEQSMARIGGKHKDLDDPLSKASALTNVGRKRAVGDPSGRNMRNFWLLGPDPTPDAHFATFPREIPRRCIAAATREGDIVLDPFVGSGTTCQVARSMGRYSIGIDLNETYLLDIALKKNAQMSLMLAVDEAI